MKVPENYFETLLNKPDKNWKEKILCFIFSVFAGLLVGMVLILCGVICLALAPLILLIVITNGITFEDGNVTIHTNKNK